MHQPITLPNVVGLERALEPFLDCSSSGERETYGLCRLRAFFDAHFDAHFGTRSGYTGGREDLRNASTQLDLEGSPGTSLRQLMEL